MKTAIGEPSSIKHHHLMPHPQPSLIHRTDHFRRVILLLVLASRTALAHDGQLHEAIAKITTQINASPTAELFHQRGRLRLVHGDAAEALSDFDEADRLAPGAADTATGRIRAMMTLGKNASALHLLDQRLQSQPDDAPSLVLRARVFDTMENLEAAARDYRRAIFLAPQPDPDLVLEASTLLLRNKQPDAALELLDQAIARLGQHSSLAYNAIEIEIARKNTDAALRRIDAISKVTPHPGAWMARRAQILTQADRRSEARAAWQNLLDHLATLPPAQQSSEPAATQAREARAALDALKPDRP